MVLRTKLRHFLNVFHKFLQSMPDLIIFFDQMAYFDLKTGKKLYVVIWQ